jgi:hypothetical protein
MIFLDNKNLIKHVKYMIRKMGNTYIIKDGNTYFVSWEVWQVQKCDGKFCIKKMIVRIGSITI